MNSRLQRQIILFQLALLIICLPSPSYSRPFVKQVPLEKSRNKREAFARSCELNQKGVLLEEQGNAIEAIECFKKAIQIYPDSSLHYCNLGNALSDLQKYAEAIEQYKKAVSISPDFALAYSNMADAYYKQKDYFSAEIACKAAIRVDPAYVPAMANLAEVYLELQKPQAAVTVLNKALGLSISSGMRKIINDDLQRAKQMMASSPCKLAKSAE